MTSWHNRVIVCLRIYAFSYGPQKKQMQRWKAISPKRCVNHHNNGNVTMNRHTHTQASSTLSWHSKWWSSYLQLLLSRADIPRERERNRLECESVHLVKHSAGVVTPNKNGTHFHLSGDFNSVECIASHIYTQSHWHFFPIRNANVFLAFFDFKFIYGVHPLFFRLS